MHIHAHAMIYMRIQVLLERLLQPGSKSKRAKIEADAGATAVGCPGMPQLATVGKHIKAFNGSLMIYGYFLIFDS